MDNLGPKENVDLNIGKFNASFTFEIGQLNTNYGLSRITQGIVLKAFAFAFIS